MPSDIKTLYVFHTSGGVRVECETLCEAQLLHAADMATDIPTAEHVDTPSSRSLWPQDVIDFAQTIK